MRNGFWKRNDSIPKIRIVSSHKNSPARRITLPVHWTRAHDDPAFVFVATAGDLLIIASKNQEELAIEAANYLAERPFDNGNQNGHY